ncbi:MAG: hypothetical protein RL030_1046, partial [Pseudomonadota bacterium]
LQGAPVTTFDIDALVKVDPANVERLAKALESLGARYREHGNLRPTRTDLAAGGHFLLMTDSGPFDVLGVMGGGKRFEDMVNHARLLSIGEMTIKVLSLETLIAEKRALGRPKDLAVLALLEAVLAKQPAG